MRCLIIDDDESARILMERLIARAGHRAETVSSCDNALGALRDDDFDVAIVDMEMPGSSGPETIERLRVVRPLLRVLVVSGHDDRRHVLAALESGADGYLLKDDLSEHLAMSLHDVRAGATPLSPRVATIMLRYLRKMLSDKVADASPLARIRPVTPRRENR
jgi:DNA-binding NarL/FixJ family response regulator